MSSNLKKSYLLQSFHFTIYIYQEYLPNIIIIVIAMNVQIYFKAFYRQY